MELFKRNKTEENKNTKEFNVDDLMKKALKESPSSLTDEEREFLLSKFEIPKQDNKRLVLRGKFI